MEEIDLAADAPAFVVAGEGDVGRILAHGGEEDGRRYFVDEATELAALGATVIVPSCGIPLVGDLARDKAPIDHAVALRRRALVLLGARGATRLGFFGHSAGGLQGAILAATENESAAEPKEWREYDCDHGALVVHPAARADRLDFFRTALAWA